MSVNTNEDDELRFPNLPPKPRLPDPPTGMNGSAVSYESLRDIFEAFEAREEALQMRIAALSFEPKQSLEALEAIKREHKSFNRYSSAEKNANPVDADDVDPILGVRLLQRLDLLQSENEDLGARIEELMQSTLLKQVEEQAAEIEGTSAWRTYPQIRTE